MLPGPNPTLPFARTVTLGTAAGMFIAFGAMYLTMVTTGNDAMGFGPGRMLGGIAFSLCRDLPDFRLCDAWL